MFSDRNENFTGGIVQNKGVLTNIAATSEILTIWQIFYAD